MSELLNVSLSVKCIAKLVEVSRWTLQRRMNDWGFSVSDLYSDLTSWCQPSTPATHMLGIE